MISREAALIALKKHIKNENMIKHSLASEAVMRALAERLNEDKEKWGIAGLLHDIDSEITNGDPKIHALKAREILGSDVPEDVLVSIEMHNEMATGKPRQEKFHKALAASETITGMITATALVYPDKKLASVKEKSIKKRMKDKRFAASVNRDIIKECEDIGVNLDDFISLSLKAMQDISDDLGL